MTDPDTEQILTSDDIAAIAYLREAELRLTGCDLISRERRRQISEEGWTSNHDDDHDSGEMALAAALYAAPILLYRKCEHTNSISFDDAWPWDVRWDKRPQDGNVLLENGSLSRSDRVRQLAKAGALIAAEIDRLQRAALAEHLAENPHVH